MSDAELSAADLTLPIKRSDGETLEERLTANAYHNILPARYLRKNADGDLIEDQEDLFDRVGKNIALAEAVYEAENRDREITVTPDQLKPDHPRRDELAAEVFGAGTTVEDSEGQRPLEQTAKPSTTPKPRCLSTTSTSSPTTPSSPNSPTRSAITSRTSPMSSRA